MSTALWLKRSNIHNRSLRKNWKFSYDLTRSSASFSLDCIKFLILSQTFVVNMTL